MKDFLAIWCVGLLLGVASPLFAATTFGAPSTVTEFRQQLGAENEQFVFSGCAPAVPGASLTIAGFACTALVLDGSTPPQQIPVVQSAIALTVPNSAVVWLAIVPTEIGAAPAGWTREATTRTHYVYQATALKPDDPTGGGVIFARVEVNGGVISGIETEGLGGNRVGHGTPRTEVQQHLGAALDPFIYSGCNPAVPSSSLTIDAFACLGFVQGTETPPRLVPAVQAKAAVSVPDSATVWVALHLDTTSTPSGCGGGNWTRVTDTYYLTCANATRPADPSNGLVFLEVVVVASIIDEIKRVAPSAAQPGCTLSTRYPTLQDAVDGATAGDVLCVDGSYTIAGQLTIDKALTLQGHGATLNFTTDSTNQGIYITASNVHLEGLTIVGAQSTVFTAGQSGIVAEGADSSNYLTDLTFRDLDISSFGDACLSMRFVEHFFVESNRVADCYQAGILSLSGRYGLIRSNTVLRIDGDGVVGTEVYGIQLTKNNGTEATFPAPHHITITENIVRESITWACIDTHGGHELTFVGNIVENCKFGLNLTSYISTPGSNLGPTNHVITGNLVRNNHGAGETIQEVDQGYGIGVNGNITNNALGQNITITGNIIDGFGDENAGIADTFGGSITAQYISGLTITGNILQNNHRHGILLFSIAGLHAVGNSIYTITGGAAPVAATGAITLTGLPVATETVTVNGAVYTWVAAATNPYEVTIGGSAAAAATNLQTALGTNSEEDGRVDVATFEDGGSVVNITYNQLGRSGNSFTLAEASSNLTVSGATLTGGAAGSAGIQLDTLAGGAANTGYVAQNVFSLTGYTAMQMDADNTGMDFADNRVLVGTPYDLQGASASPQSGAGNIQNLAQSVWVKDPASIADGAAETIYLPAPGISSSGVVSVTPSRALDGLIMSARPQDGGFVAVQLQNESGGAIDLASTTWMLQGHRVAADR